MKPIANANFHDFRKNSLIGPRWKPCLIALLALACPAGAIAGTWNWGTASGSWHAAENWVSLTDPGTVPSTDTASTVVNLTNGTTLSPSVTTLTSDWAAGRDSSITINSHNTLTLSAGLLVSKTGSSLTNHGIIQASSVGALNSSGSATKSNDGTIQALSGGTLSFLGFGPLTNTGGLILAKSGGTIAIQGSSIITGGTLKSEAGGTIHRDTAYNVGPSLTLNSVTVDNQGTFTSNYDSDSVNTQTLQIQVNLGADTVFTNAANALTQIRNTGTGGLSNGNRNSLFNVNAGASFRNNGTLLIENNATRTGSLTVQAATFGIASEATEFSNSGTIKVIANTTGTGATAAFTSAKSITNGGIVHIKGNPNNEFATFSVTGTGNDYTQSGSGTQRTVLERGGALSAARNVTINAGSLGGVGSVSGVTTIGGNAVLFAGETFAGTAGAGILAFANDLILSDDAEVKFGLGLDTATSGRVTLAGDLFLGMNLTLTLSDLSEGNWISGATYRLFDLASGTVYGDLAHLSLALPTGWTAALSSGPGGTGFLDATLTRTAVPEPSSMSLLLGSVTLVIALTRRYRRMISV